MAAGVAEILATSYEFREKKPSDVVKDNIAVLYALDKKGRVTTVPGGPTFWETIKHAKNNYLQRINSTQEIVMGLNQTMTNLEYSPKILVVPVLISMLEGAQNAGEEKFLDLLKERNDIAESTMMNGVEEDLQGDGTGYGGLALAGIKSYIVTATTTGSYGGLARASYTGLQNIAQLGTSLGAGGVTDATNIESRYRYVKNLLLRNGSPELVLAGQTHYNAACDAASAKQRFTKNEEMYKMNFDNVVIEGMTIVNAKGRIFSGTASSRIADDRSYFIRLDNFAMRWYKGFDIRPVDKRTSFNQLVEAGLIVGMGQFTCSGSGLSGVLYDS